ncbi:MAG TPA: cache domain-containing protein [Ktedonosporobacter sp.]|nr:cache domain-containing protein [Ktedonosporobacter sp.]
MSTKSNTARRIRGLSLTARVSGFLMLATILPLLVIIIVIESLSRPTLIDQAGKNMQADASTHTQLIDNFFSQQLLETDALSRLVPIQQYLAGERSPAAYQRALEALASGRGRGSFYEGWSLLNLQGALQLYYPTVPTLHGQYYIAPSDLKQFQLDSPQAQQARRARISDVFYNAVTHEAYMDIYAPVFSNDYHLIGILRASFDLHYIWQIVTQEAGVNGLGSYAFITDQRGVIVSYTNSDPDPFTSKVDSHLFKSLTPLSDNDQKQAQQLELYGLQANAIVPVLDGQPQENQKLNGGGAVFQMKPPDMQNDFQVARSTTYTVPWSYFVLSPLSNITAVADDQLRITLLVTTGILVLSALFGFGMGRRITHPIMRSVELLLKSSQDLKTLATKEQSAATQQTWVVDSSQTGLKSVQYYTNAASLAVQRLNETGMQLVQHWDRVDPAMGKQAMTQVVTDARYLDKALQYQIASNQKLESAIKVTVSVNDQLASGARSATDAASQLEEVVDELRQVVGK